MKNVMHRMMMWLMNPKTHWIGRISVCLGLMMISDCVLATDLLTGTTADAIDTMKGSGRNWAYIIDGALSLGAFAYTKKPFVFFSVLGVALGITAITKLAGG